jgi:hypothetical protein
MTPFSYLLSTLALAALSSAAPAPISIPTDPYADSNPNPQLWNPNSRLTPQPIRGPLGATIIGPQNVEIELQNPDLLAPPTTDNGELSNMKWPFSLSHNRLANGGWARQQNGILTLAFALE